MNRKQFSEPTYNALNLLIEKPKCAEKIGTALFQREFKIGYARAADIIDELCECGLIERPTEKGFPSYCKLRVSIDELRKIMES